MLHTLISTHRTTIFCTTRRLAGFASRAGEDRADLSVPSVSTGRIGGLSAWGITILGDLMSTAVWEDFPADIAAACKVRAIEAVKASAADQRIDQRAQRSSGAEQLRSAFGKRERRR
jgi:hypothetical protein